MSSENLQIILPYFTDAVCPLLLIRILKCLPDFFRCSQVPAGHGGYGGSVVTDVRELCGPSSDHATAPGCAPGAVSSAAVPREHVTSFYTGDWPRYGDDCKQDG